jgi:mono/diheme cytochrome c family protein
MLDNKLKLTFSALLGAVALTMSAPAFAQDAAVSERRGAALVAQQCAMCHAVGRFDESLERQAPPLRTMSRRVPLDRLEQQLGAGLLGGHPIMPKFAFAARDVDAIMRYLRSIQEP